MKIFILDMSIFIFNKLDIMKKRILLLTKIFVIGLLLQFFVQTFVTFELWFTGTFWDLVWLWKEIFIIIFFVIACILLYKKYFQTSTFKEGIKKFWQEFPIKWFLVVFVLLLVFLLVVSLLKYDFLRFAVSVKYSMVGFLIFLIWFVISRCLFDFKDLKINDFYGKIIKFVVVWGLFWWFIIWLAPWFLNRFGYNQRAFEWEIWQEPPSVYYTEYKEGLVRNQFLFERPITLWFFLVAFWPLFFVYYMRKGKKSDFIIWGGLYWILMFSTFSRAAWGAWFVQTVLLLILTYKNSNIKLKQLLYLFIPAVILVWVVGFFAKDQIINRYYSDTGHIREIRRAVDIITEDPLWGKWPASAGPASHQISYVLEYNTENQYLQIWVEYGVVWFIMWMFLYLSLIWFGWGSYTKKPILAKNLSKKQLKQESEKQDFQKLVIIAFSLWVVGLSIEGLVLHSFVDRMVVYPFMILFGISLAIYYKDYNSLKGDII